MKFTPPVKNSYNHQLIAMKVFVSASFALLLLLGTACKKEKTPKAIKKGGENVLKEQD
jgi:hypothetical protein